MHSHMKERFESDHTESHVLRYRRLRVERQEVLFGDADPLLCRQGDALVLAGRGGSLAHSDDGGVTWSQVADLATPEAPGGVVLALTAGRDGTLFATVQRSGSVVVLGADDPAGPWRVLATPDVDPPDSPRACLTALADGALLLCLPGRILCSTDGGAAWEPAGRVSSRMRDAPPAAARLRPAGRPHRWRCRRHRACRVRGPRRHLEHSGRIRAAGRRARGA